MDTRHAIAPLQPPEPTPALTPTYSRGNAKTTPKLLIASMVAACLTLAACSSQPAPAPTKLPIPIPASSTPATPSASPTESTQAPQTPTETPASINTPARQREDLEPPVLSDVALENSFDGAEAYAYFLFQAWWYLINTLDVEWWDQNIPPCGWKEEMRAKATHQLSEGTYNELDQFTPYVFDSRVNPDNHNEFIVTMRAELPAINMFDKQGIMHVSRDAGTYELVARVLFDQEHWRTVGVVNHGVEHAQ